MNWPAIAMWVAIAQIPTTLAGYVGIMVWIHRNFSKARLFWPGMFLLAPVAVIAFSGIAQYKAAQQLATSLSDIALQSELILSLKGHPQQSNADQPNSRESSTRRSTPIRVPTFPDVFASEKPKHQLPDAIGPEDQKTLIASLKPYAFRFQILRDDNEKCIRFANTVSQVLVSAGWTEVARPLVLSPDIIVPGGISVKSSALYAATSAVTGLWAAFRELGIAVDHAEDPEMRRIDHVEIFISDRPWSPHSQ